MRTNSSKHETVLVIEPDQPVVSHPYIHTMEASPTPEKAIAAADVDKRFASAWAGADIAIMSSCYFRAEFD